MGQRKHKKRYLSKSAETTQLSATAVSQKVPEVKTTINQKRKINKRINKVDTRGLWLPALALVIITFIVFYPSLSLKFVNWDDPTNLLVNPTLQSFGRVWSWTAVKQIFTTDVIGGYNPLSIFSFALEKHFFAPNPAEAPFVFHFNNLWMHLVCTLLVFFIFIHLGLGKIPALFGALLFGIHPMRVESVAWVTERKDVLYGMFFLAALLTYIQYIKSTSKTRWYLLTLLLAVCAYFSKIQAVTLPLSMLVFDFFYNRRWLSFKILVIEKLPFWILSLVLGLVNIYFLNRNKVLLAEADIADYTFFDRLALGAYSYITYLAKWVFPFKMSPLYPFPGVLPIGAYVALVLLPLALIAIFIWGFRKNKKLLLFGIAFFTFNIMFMLQIVSAGQGFIADRFTYIAYVGLFFLTAAAVQWIIERKPSLKTVTYSASAAYLVVFAIMTINQIKVWENGGTLWEHAKKIFPGNSLVWSNAGSYYRDDEKNYGKAIENHTMALKLSTRKGGIYNSIGKSYIDQMPLYDPNTPDGARKRLELAHAAVETFTAAVREDSLNGRKNHKATGEYIANLGISYAALGQFDRALMEIANGLQFNPNNVNAYENRAKIYFYRQQYDLAIREYNLVLTKERYNSNAYYNRGISKSALGDSQGAIADYTVAITLSPAKSSYYLERAKDRRKIGDINGSRADALQAQQLGAQVPQELLQ